MESESEEEDKREMEDYGEHLRQNNLRLVTLAQVRTIALQKIISLF